MSIICRLRSHDFGKFTEVKRDATGPVKSVSAHRMFAHTVVAARTCKRCGFEERTLTRKDAVMLRRIAIVTGHDKLYRFAEAQLEKVLNG